MSVIGSNMLLGGAAAGPAPVGLLAYWNLENDGNDGLGVSNMTATDITFNGSEALFGATGGLSTPSSALLNVLTDMSISVWLYPTDVDFDYTSVISHIVTGGGEGNVNYNLIVIPGGLMTLHTRRDAGQAIFHISANVWTHIVVTRDTSGFVEFFKNGSSIATGTGPAPWSVSAPTRISAGPNYNYWRGSMKRVGIWGRILSGAEVSYLYNSGSGRAYPDVP